MNSKMVAVAAACAALSGCSAATTVKPVDFRASRIVATPSMVVDQVWCEIYWALEQNRAAEKTLGQYTILANVALKDSRTANLTPGLTISPTTPTGLGLPAGLTTSDKGSREKGFSVTSTLSEFMPPRAMALSTYCEDADIARPEDGIGLKQWVEATVEATQGPVGAQLGGTTYSIFFEVARTITGGVTFKTAVVNLEFGKQSAGSTESNRLDVTIGPPSADASKGTAKGKPADDTTRLNNLSDTILNRSNTFTLVDANGNPIGQTTE